VYSIDEAFLILENTDLDAVCQHIRATIKQWVGIPVSIGVSKTKTLAKVAADIAKKRKQGYAILNEETAIEKHLADMPIRDVWGIGRGMEAGLKNKGVTTALEFIQLPNQIIRMLFKVTGMRIAEELRGNICFEVSDVIQSPLSIIRSRSFSKPLTELADIEEALSRHAAKAAEKLRKENLVAHALQVFINTSPHQEGYYGNIASIRLPEPTSYTPILITHAKAALRTIYRPGFLYKKAGIQLSEFTSEEAYQRDLFANRRNEKKQKALMTVLDGMNKQGVHKTLAFAAEGVNPVGIDAPLNRYTSCWDELLIIHI
jgi:DNA polymerase V